MNLKTKILFASTIAFISWIVVTYGAGFLGQSYDDLKASWWSTVLTEDLWNTLIHKVENISTTDWWTTQIWPQSDWQWTLVIHWSGDGNQTHSALYLSDTNKDHSNTWYIAHKKLVWKANQWSLEIWKWKNSSIMPTVTITEDWNLNAYGTICDKNGCIGWGQAGSGWNCVATTKTSGSCSYSLPSTNNYKVVGQNYNDNRWSGKGIFQCYDWAWIAIDTSCIDSGWR